MLLLCLVFKMPGQTVGVVEDVEAALEAAMARRNGLSPVQV